MPSLPGVTGIPARRAVSRAVFLSPIERMADGRRPDELDVAARADLREVRVFAQEAVAGMNRIRIADLRGADDAVDLQIALVARAGADADGLVGELHVERIHVGLGINGEGLDALLLAGADDAQGDFAAVRDEDFLEHDGS